MRFFALTPRHSIGRRQTQRTPISPRFHALILSLEKILDHSPRQLGYDADQWTMSLLGRHSEEVTASPLTVQASAVRSNG